MSPTSPEAVKSLIVAFKKNLLDRKLDDMSLVAERQAIIRSWTNPYPVTPTTPPHRLPACLAPERIGWLRLQPPGADEARDSHGLRSCPRQGRRGCGNAIESGWRLFG